MAGSGNYAEGATVTLQQMTEALYIHRLEVRCNLADATARTTTFIMPAKAVTVTANYRQNTSSGSGSEAVAQAVVENLQARAALPILSLPHQHQIKTDSPTG